MIRTEIAVYWANEISPEEKSFGLFLNYCTNYYGKLRILLLFPTDLWYMIRCVEIKNIAGLAKWNTGFPA